MQTYLEEWWAEHRCRVSEVSRLVHLKEVIRLAPVGLPHLPQQRLAQVKELVLLEILHRVRLLGFKVISYLPVIADYSFACTEATNEEFV